MEVGAVWQEAPGAEIVLAAVGEEPGVHLVGGAVRDAALGRVPRELDLVVEGDAVAVARRAAARLAGELTVHPRFGTATVTADGVSFDLAAARRERYARPGALPDVELGATLAEDLARRDFTVNAMALRLADGALTTWPGAGADLAARVLRILHSGSFRDDPTRALRLARYAARLGFAPDPETDRQLAGAVAAGAMATVSGERLGRELRLLLREPQPAALLALARHGLGEAVAGPGFAVDPDLVAAIERACPPDARCELALLAASAPAAPLETLGFPAREREVIRAAARAHAPRDDAPPAEVWRALRRLPTEAAALLAARGSVAARRWLDDLRHRRLAITGDDLLAAGLRGPAVGAGLEAAMAAMLEGRAGDRDAQLAVARGS